ncbi:hypothetical protein F4680DRAFT_438424 [Xylaria scruposa]|nr:hypothetical protein F4680DRAFT_438424 [Xylaria scruposa]
MVGYTNEFGRVHVSALGMQHKLPRSHSDHTLIIDLGKWERRGGLRHQPSQCRSSQIRQQDHRSINALIMAQDIIREVTAAPQAPAPPAFQRRLGFIVITLPFLYLLQTSQKTDAVAASAVGNAVAAGNAADKYKQTANCGSHRTMLSSLIEYRTGALNTLESCLTGAGLRIGCGLDTDQTIRYALSNQPERLLQVHYKSSSSDQLPLLHSNMYYEHALYFPLSVRATLQSQPR